MQQHRQRSASFAIAGPDSLPQKRYYYVVVAQDESIAMLFHAHAGREGGSGRFIRMDRVVQTAWPKSNLRVWERVYK